MQSPTHSRPQKQAVQDRISQLSNKITNLHITKQDASKKYEQIQSMCDQIQSKLQDFSNFVEEKLIDVRHKTAKISKQVKKDYSVIDSLLKQEISAANQRMMTVVDQELDTQKDTSLRILKFIEHETNLIREQIQRQGHQRDQQARSIEESLANDILQITKALDQACAECRQRVQSTQNALFSRTEKLAQKLKQITTTYSDNEAQFYKMLRDLVKKVKSELQDHQIKRQETEAQILTLIDKICDKTIQEKKI